MSEYDYTLRLHKCHDKSTCCVCCRSSLPGSLPSRLASLVNSRLNWHVAVTRQVVINSHLVDSVSSSYRSLIFYTS